MVQTRLMEEVYTKYGAKLISVGNFEMPGEFEGVEAEYEAIRNKVGLYDLSAVGKIKVAGDNAIEFLQKLVTRDIEFLPPEKSDVYLLLNHEGAIIDQVNIYNFDEYFLIETWPTRTETVKNWLLQNIEDGVEVEDITKEMALLGLEGPYAWKVLQKVIDFDIVALSYQGFLETEIYKKKIVIARTGCTAEYGYKIFLNPGDAADIWNSFTKQEPDLVKPVGLEALKICRTESRFPLIDDETKENETLFEAELNWMVDFSKEDYIGFEAVKKLRENISKRLVCIKLLTAGTLADGDLIMIDNVNIGKVVNAVYSPSLATYIGVAYLQNDFAAAGLDLEVKTLSGDVLPVKTVSAPFITPKSWAIKIE